MTGTAQHEARRLIRRTADGADVGAIVFDPQRIPQPDDGWFDPAHWGAAATPVTQGGRGAAWLIEASSGPMVLRHYRRGGWAARISRDRYWWHDEDTVRSVAEFRLTAHLYAAGLPVPAPLAAAYWREGGSYRAAILLQRLPNAQSLASLLQTDADWPWPATGALLARFHRHGLDHADLNATNILFDATQAGWLIDFDRCRMRSGAGPTHWRQRNLQRLRRSLHKLRGPRSLAQVDARFRQLQLAYAAAMEQTA